MEEKAPSMEQVQNKSGLTIFQDVCAGADWAVGHSGANRGPENLGGPEFTRFRITTNYLSKHLPNGLHMRNHISKSVKLQKLSHVKQILPKFASIHCNFDCPVCPLTPIYNRSLYREENVASHIVLL